MKLDMPPQLTFELDTHTLRSDFYPSPSQITHLHSLINTTQLLSSRLQAELQTLQAFQTQLNHQLSLQTALISPIRKLPPELLILIFEFCSVLSGPPTYSPRDSPIILTHVCHRFRRIALNTPSLWRVLEIGNRYPLWRCRSSFFDFGPNVMIEYERLKEPLEMWLERAKGVSLDVNLQLEQGINSARLCLWVMGWGTEALGRIGNLSIKGGMDSLRAVLPVDKSHSWTNLEKISIEATPRHEMKHWDSTPDLDGVIWTTPKLRTMELVGVEVIRLLTRLVRPAGVLKRLVLKGDARRDLFEDPTGLSFFDDSLMDFLRQCADSLTYLELSFPFSFPSTASTPSNEPYSPLVFPHLHTLKLHLLPTPSTAHCASQTFAAKPIFITPCLEVLEILDIHSPNSNLVPIREWVNTCFLNQSFQRKVEVVIEEKNL